jgi:hypothetical protein
LNDGIFLLDVGGDSWVLAVNEKFASVEIRHGGGVIR